MTTTLTSTNASVACDHCGLPVPESLFEEQAESQFCCGGCRVAYDTIRDCGLDAYYTHRDRFAEDRQSSRGEGKRYAAYDSEAFQQKHTEPAGDGLRAIDFRLEGVHCAACVWLVERLGRVAPGVIDSRLTLGTGRARVVWDAEQTPLSEIAASLDRLGYKPHPARDADTQQRRNQADRKRLILMAIAGALAGNNMLIAVALYAGFFEGIESAYAQLFRWMSMAIGLLSLCWPGMTFFRGAWAAVRTRTANLDLPIALALGAGGIAGIVNVLLDRGEIYFDSLSTLVFLLLVGRLIQAKQQRWVEEAVGSMLAITPDACRVVRDGIVAEESVDALQPGDVVEVRPGELLPVDGQIIRGESAIDQSLLTGESLPTPAGPGKAVFAGTLNVASTIRARVDQVGAQTRVGKLTRLVEEGIASKPPIVQFADRVGGWFVAVVLTLALANFVWWSLTVGSAAAVDATVALLIVACPCALGLATPLTMAVAIGYGSKRGMLIKSAAVLEKIAGVNPDEPGRLLLDKTGTLTTGDLRVEAWSGDDRLKRWVAAIETESRHPIACALIQALGPADPRDCDQIDSRTEHHGFGVTGRTPIGELLVGSVRYAERNACRTPQDIARTIALGRDRGYSVVVAALDKQVLAVAWLRDELHAETSDRLEQLRRRGWRCEILSGDEPGAVRRTASLLGMAEQHAYGGVSPEEKLACVNEHVRRSDRSVVMMVGDGVNDAAALAAADIGVAVHGGAEASLAAADVYLAGDGVTELTALVALARQTMRVVRRNLAISLAYNIVAVCLAAAGLITPLVAAVLMPISSASVLGSAIAFGKGEE